MNLSVTMGLRELCFTQTEERVQVFFCLFSSSGSHRYTQVLPSKNAVIPAEPAPVRDCRGMQESSAMDGNLPSCKWLIQRMHTSADSPPCDWIPAVHAGMTSLNTLCITMKTLTWERGLLRSASVHGKLELEK